MDAQRKLRNLLSYAKTDSVEELEDCNKLYEELLAHLNKQEKKDELSLLKSRIINEYQRYLVCLDTHDYKLKEVVKNEIFKILDEKGILEKELGEMK